MNVTRITSRFDKGIRLGVPFPRYSSMVIDVNLFKGVLTLGEGGQQLEEFFEAKVEQVYKDLIVISCYERSVFFKEERWFRQELECYL